MEEYKNALEKDLKFGLAEEDKLLQLFRERFDKCLSKTNTFAIIDFISPKTYLELKSRNCNHDKFDDIMIGENKIRFAEKTKKRVILVWNFQDGIYFYEFKKEDIENGNIQFRMGGRTDRGKNEKKMCAYVSSSLLVPLLEKVEENKE